MSNIDFVGRIQKAESNGRRFGADGQILQGPATKYGTAKGEMQVLDGTTRDPGFGVVPARDGSPAERARVGVDYVQAMLRQFGGNEALAAAAYNHGPGNVQKLVAKHGDNWAAFLPKETKAYIAKVTSGSEGGGQLPLRAAPAAPSLAGVVPVQVPVGGSSPAPVAAPPVVVAEQAAPAPVVAQSPEVDAWQAFLSGMPQARQPVVPEDLNFASQAVAAPQFQHQVVANRVPNFAAFSSWKGRAA